MEFSDSLAKIKEDSRYQNANLVAIQLPEGLKRQAETISKQLGEKDLIFLGDPFWGACDIPVYGKWDLLIQFGHSPIPNLGSFQKVMFVELQEGMVNDIDLTRIPFKDMTLTSNITYSNQLRSIKDKLENNGFKVNLKKGDSRILYPGQILGCNVSAARGESKNILFVGEGIFHPLGIALAFDDKKVIAFNPRTNEYVDMEKEKMKFLRQRYGAVDKASRAALFGVIISTKVGQIRYTMAKKAKEILEKNGRRVIIISLDLIREEELINFPADIYVNTACPRVTIEDYGTFSRPVITFYELQMALGVRDKSRYILDEIIMTDEIGSTGFRKRN